jgi:hypothetical protein
MVLQRREYLPTYRFASSCPRSIRSLYLFFLTPPSVRLKTLGLLSSSGSDCRLSRTWDSSARVEATEEYPTNTSVFMALRRYHMGPSHFLVFISRTCIPTHQ